MTTPIFLQRQTLLQGFGAAAACTVCSNVFSFVLDVVLKRSCFLCTFVRLGGTEEVKSLEVTSRVVQWIRKREEVTRSFFSLLLSGSPKTRCSNTVPEKYKDRHEINQVRFQKFW